jgi:hypothetical protein
MEKIQLEFCVVTSRRVVVGYQRFKGPRCVHLHSQDGRSVDLRKVVTLSQHYTTSHRGRSLFECTKS